MPAISHGPAVPENKLNSLFDLLSKRVDVMRAT